MSKVFLAVAAISIAQTAIAESDTTLSELDAVWAELSRTVVEGDFEGMAAVYHLDAKMDGEWKVMMEYQKSRAALAEWQALEQ